MKSPHSFGSMSVTALFSSGLPAPRLPRQVVASFLRTAEGVALRWIDTRKGVMLLQMAPHEPASGSIYIYDRIRDFWYRLSFEKIDDTFTVELFKQAYKEYGLLNYVIQPGLLLQMLDEPLAEIPPRANRADWDVADPQAEQSLQDVSMIASLDSVLLRPDSLPDRFFFAHSFRAAPS